MERAVYIGRFQPFHNGHLKAVEYIDDNYDFDEIMIIVGTNLSSHEKENPMSVGERIDMIERVFKDYEINDRISVKGISDIQHNPVWIGHVTSQIPKFTTIFSNNPLVKRLVKDSPYDYELCSIDLHEREVYRGSTIRDAIKKDYNWKETVPLQVYDFMIENDLDGRIRDINGRDY